MKKILTLAMLAIAAMTAQAQTEELYEARMAVIDAQGEQIIKEYKALAEKDPKGELPDTKLQSKKLMERYEALSKEQLELVKEIIRDNHDNNIPAKYIKDTMYELGYEGLKEALDPTAAYYNHPDLEKPKLLLASYDKRKPGIQFHELTMDAPDGATVQLSQWVGRGNYVLIDFWASWCGPCRQEMPNVVANYEKYHPKGFEIVGVSFDQKKESWVNAVQQMGMKWPQMSDLKGWKSAGAEAYGIRSIPSSVFVDPQGKIVAIDLRGAALGDKLKEIYGE